MWRFQLLTFLLNHFNHCGLLEFVFRPNSDESFSKATHKRNKELKVWPFQVTYITVFFCFVQLSKFKRQVSYTKSALSGAGLLILENNLLLLFIYLLIFQCLNSNSGIVVCSYFYVFGGGKPLNNLLTNANKAYEVSNMGKLKLR